MWDWGYVSDGAYLESQDTKCSDGAFATYTRSLYKDIDFPESRVHSLLSSCLTSCLSSVRSRLLCTSESESTCRSPGNCIARKVSESNDSIVEGCLDVDISFKNSLLDFFLCCSYFSFPLISSFQRLSSSYPFLCGH